MQKVTEMFFPMGDTFNLCVEYVTLSVLSQDCFLLGPCLYLPQGSVHLWEVVISSGRLQAFCFSLPESSPVFSYRDVVDAIQAVIFSYVSTEMSSSTELYDF